MLVGVAFLPPSFPPSGTQAFYIIKRENCVYFCNRVYICWHISKDQDSLQFACSSNTGVKGQRTCSFQRVSQLPQLEQQNMDPIVLATLITLQKKNLDILKVLIRIPRQLSWQSGRLQRYSAGISRSLVRIRFEGLILINLPLFLTLFVVIKNL